MRSGAGKTTTIRILLGLLRRDGGDARLLGGDPWRDATRLHSRVAYVPGDVTLWPSLTGGEIIDLLARLRGDGGGRNRRRELIDAFELDPAFTGISAVAAQLAAGARGARGLAIGLLGLSFLLRGIGDAAGAGAGGPAWLTWALPLGWTELLRPFAAERWWVLALPLALCGLGIGGAFRLNERRDLGAGLLPGRPGRASATAALRGPLSLAWRLQGPTLAGWTAGYVFLFAACGAAAKGIGQLFGTSSALRNEFARIGGQPAIVNAYLAALMLLAGLGASAGRARRRAGPAPRRPGDRGARRHRVRRRAGGVRRDRLDRPGAGHGAQPVRLVALAARLGA
jgi:hypothetical protein